SRCAGSALFVAALVTLATPVRAADCSTLPNPLFVAGSSAVQPLLAAIGRILVGGTTPTTIVYLGTGSCVGVNAILSGTPIMGSGMTALTYWDPNGTPQQCDVPANAPVNADIGVSDVFANTCFKLPGGLPSNVGDFLGPVQSMTFVVPQGSTQTSISAEA